jgi:hypothetical protein
MAKKAPRSTATKLNNGPESISEPLSARESDAVAGLASAEPSDDEIRSRAYEMYLERGGHDGLDLDDWVRAERELRQRR